VLMMGLKGTPSLYIFESPCSLGILELCDHSCYATFSRSWDFLEEMGVGCVGSFTYFLYAESSKGQLCSVCSPIVGGDCGTVLLCW
jgi:hypothetical protein